MISTVTYTITNILIGSKLKLILVFFIHFEFMKIFEIYNILFLQFFSVEIVPISKDSIVCLSKKMTNQLGNISPFCIVNRVTSTIHLIDPNSAQSKSL